jgi:flavorubredoxin
MSEQEEDFGESIWPVKSVCGVTPGRLVTLPPRRNKVSLKAGPAYRVRRCPMARIDEIAPDVYRVSIYAPQFDLQFNHFLIKDEEPLLFHTGMRRMFPEVRDVVARLIDPADLRWISWSHFEVDECGALNEWLAVAPRAQAVCSQVGAAVNIEDFAHRPPRGLGRDDVIETGRHVYRYVPTPHLPHGWDAGVLFDEKSGVLLCSDLFHQLGDVEAVTTADVLGRWDAAVAAYQAHPVLMDYVPLTPATRRRLNELADLQPTVLAAMHGSSFVGDGEAALRAAADMLQRRLGAAPVDAVHAA